MRRTSTYLMAVALVGLLTAAAARAQSARLEGRLAGAGGEALSGVRVEVEETGQTAVTDAEGVFGLSVRDGVYTVRFRLAKEVLTLTGIEVPFDGVARIERRLPWPADAVEATAIRGATLRPDRRWGGFSSAAVARRAEIAPQAAHGQVPRLLAAQPGIDLTENSVFEFGLGSRGFNDPLSRNVAIRVDGRDTREPFFGGQQWASLALPLDDLAQVELVRGPSSALYGVNASGGVLHLVTRRPSAGSGGTVRIGAGERGSQKLDLRAAGRLAGGWHYKALAAFHASEGFSVSRGDAVEYSTPCAESLATDCLPLEAVPLTPLGDDVVGSASLRFDYSFRKGDLLQLELGQTDVDGPLRLTELGRVQSVDDETFWARLDFASFHWQVDSFYRRRQADRQTLLATGTNLALREVTWSTDARSSWQLAGDRLRLLGGVHFADETVDSLDPTGPVHPSRLNPVDVSALDDDLSADQLSELLGAIRAAQQSLMAEPVDSDGQAAYLQAEWTPGARTRVLLGARYDRSTLHSSQLSTRAALVWAPVAGQTLRLSLGQGFRAPTYLELYLLTDLAAPLNLATLEPICSERGYSCGFDLDSPFTFGDAPADDTGETRIVALGNPDLDVEEVVGFEIGYGVILRPRAELTIDYHRAERERVIAGPLPQVGTALGRVAPTWGVYRPPAALGNDGGTELASALAAALGDRLPYLSTLADGTPILAMSSFTNLGDVDSQGVDVALEMALGADWRLELGYSWFDFSPAGVPDELRRAVAPNAPEHRFGGTLSGRRDRWDWSLAWRWVDDYRWSFGPFTGAIDSYTTADATLGFRASERIGLGLVATNLTDDEHWEAFGGDHLARRALATLSVDW